MKKSLLSFLLLCLLPLLLTACEAAGPRFCEASLTPNQAAIYVYRYSNYQGSAVTMNIEVDKKKIGELKSNGYVYTLVAPGAHIVSCSTESESAVEILAQPGNSYYIEGEIVLGFWVGRPVLKMVDPQSGRANIGGKLYSGPATQPAQ